MGNKVLRSRDMVKDIKNVISCLIDILVVDLFGVVLFVVIFYGGLLFLLFF